MTRFTIFLGTYERLLVGLEVHFDRTSSEGPSLKMTTGYAAHLGSIKTLAIADHHFLATGSTDEMIKLYDLRLRQEFGSMRHHEGSITALQFYRHSHLVSASEDGTLLIYRCKDWEALHSLKGHQGPVLDLALHPSGKVVLSIGQDGTLRMWDLLRGRLAYTTKPLSLTRPALAALQRQGFRLGAERVFWNEDGTRYALLYTHRVQVCAAEPTSQGDTPHNVIEAPHVRQRFLCASFVRSPRGKGKEEGKEKGKEEEKEKVEECMLTGGEDGWIRLWSLDAGVQRYAFQAHPHRVRSLQVVSMMSEKKDNQQQQQQKKRKNDNPLREEEKKEQNETWLVTCSSNGQVKVWLLDSLFQAEPSTNLLAEHDCGCRLTCMAVQQPQLDASDATEVVAGR